MPVSTGVGVGSMAGLGVAEGSHQARDAQERDDDREHRGGDPPVPLFLSPAGA